jgi:hypothetical protein
MIISIWDESFQNRGIPTLGREVIKTTSSTVGNYRKQACTAMAGETICRILQDGTVSTS